MEWNITQIEDITENYADSIAEEKLTIKDHAVYLVDFKGYFGYSALVFRNGKHIKYANDYELHHSWLTKEKGRDALRDYYIESMNKKLYTDDELVAPLKDYNEYEAKQRFLINLYPLQIDYVSIFAVNPSEEEKAEFKRKTATMTYNPVSFCYMDDKEFVKHQIELMKELDKRKSEMADNYEYYVEAFLYEMYNHEYGINWEADHDTLSAFGNVGWHDDDLNAYFDELEFTETQRKAYMAARNKYWENEREAM